MCGKLKDLSTAQVPPLPLAAMAPSWEGVRRKMDGITGCVAEGPQKLVLCTPPPATRKTAEGGPQSQLLPDSAMKPEQG